MKNTLLIFSLFLISVGLFAQKAEIVGDCADSNSDEKIPFATVSLFRTDFSELVKGAVSDNNGNFKIEDVQPGEYRAVVSFIGYKPDTSAMISVTLDKNHYLCTKYLLFHRQWKLRMLKFGER
jgi:hypothetical protein